MNIYLNFFKPILLQQFGNGLGDLGPVGIECDPTLCNSS